MKTRAQKMAHGLGWFGIGLGLIEFFAPRAVARAAGLGSHTTLIRAFGAREIASGVLVLSAKDPENMVWVRVAGDALDAALLGKGLFGANQNKGRTTLASLLVAPVVLLDWIVASKSPAEGMN